MTVRWREWFRQRQQHEQKAREGMWQLWEPAGSVVMAQSQGQGESKESNVKEKQANT